MHRSSLKPPAQAKKVPPPAIPGDLIIQQQQQQQYHHHQQQQQQQQQQIPLYRLGGSVNTTNRQLTTTDNGIIMSSLVSSPSLEEGGFNLPRETSVALRMKDEITDYATMSTSGTSSQLQAPQSATSTILPPCGATTNAPAVGVAAAAAAATAITGASATATIAGLAANKQQQSTTNPQIGLLPPTAVTNPLLSGCPPTIVPCPPPVFCATLREPLTHKAAVYYHQQLALQEDQGIDLTQSPGRDSPGSSSGSAGSGSRHSTASLDSGRASSYLTGVSGASIRGSTGGGSSSGGGGPLSSPRCSSLSSCSIGSVDRQRNDELIIDWLMEMKYEEYAQLFIAAGYDLPTIARMTPEDLTAIGIKNPHHRERIKQRIDKLQVLDNLPHFVPGSIEEWLQLLRLEEYIQPLLDQNYKTVRDVTQVTWEDLEDIGIVKLGHQKKILLAIKRVKDIISGKWNPGGPNAYQQQEYRKIWPNIAPACILPPPTPLTPNYIPTTRVSWDDSKIYTPTTDAAYYCTGSNHECCTGNDVVLIKVRQPRGKSLESLEDIHDNSTRSHLTFSHYTTTDYGHFAHPTQMQQQLQHHQAFQQQQQHLQQQQHAAALMAGTGNRLLSNPPAMSWRRSYDDGDITPTNDAGRDLVYEEGGGTLPRQQRGILQRAVLNTMPPLEHHHYMNAAAAAEYVCHTVGLGGSGGGVGIVGSNISAGGILSGGPNVVHHPLMDGASLNAAYLTGSPMTQKKIAPEPPRRHCSIRNSRALSSDGSGTSGGSSIVSAQYQQQQQQQQQQTQQQQQQSLITNAQNLYYGGAGGGVVGVGVGGQMSMHHHNPAAAYMQHQQHQQQQQQPIYANYATIQQTTAEIHCEKFHDNKSNSSIDSIDTIPFANENTGTIKQRLLNRQEMSNMGTGNSATLNNTQQAQHLHSSSSSSSSSSTNTIGHSFHTMKSSTSLHDASLIRSDSIGSNTSGGSAGAATTTTTTSMIHLRSPTLQYPPEANQSFTGASSASPSAASGAGTSATTITTTVDLHAPIGGGGGGGGNTPDASTGGSATGTAQSNVPKVSVNVLNDIGNMLANLTDELDAMLEEEKRVGLNIDSE